MPEISLSVWVGCLACYNNGLLIGQWCDAKDAKYVTAEDIHDQPTYHDELWCFDLEGFPTGTGEMSPETASLWGDLHHDIGKDRWPVYLAWAEYTQHECSDPKEMPDLTEFEECYEGRFFSFQDYLEPHIEALQEGWPDDAIRYFDEATYVRDALHDYIVIDAPNHDVYVFRYL